ncbi:MAG: signal peptidase I [Candidatus Melainabacteria bacterium]|jgi:signal peptidase I
MDNNQQSNTQSNSTGSNNPLDKDNTRKEYLDYSEIYSSKNNVDIDSEQDSDNKGDRKSGNQDSESSSFKGALLFGKEITEFILILLVLLVVIRQGIFERRYIPSESMLPNLQIGDQLIIEKVTRNLRLLKIGKDLQRGDIIVFYPPPEANYGEDIHKDFPNTFVRMTGLSSDLEIKQIGSMLLEKPIKPFFFLPKAEDAYIKRIVGLPGDQIEIKEADGVYINGVKLEEDHVIEEKPMYSIKKMSDIPLLNQSLQSDKPIVVPPNHYFCLGDNRNNSNDGHIWGFVKKDRIVGRALSIIWRDLGELKPYLSE